MNTCRDILAMQLDGVSLLAGETGLDRVISWTYIVQAKPFEAHMNMGNFALLEVDYVRFDMEAVYEAMVELNQLGISGLAVCVVDDREPISEKIISKAEELQLPLFRVSWKGISFVDFAQSVGKLLLETGVKNKREGDFLYNLLFGYEINAKYIEKISTQFKIDFTSPCRVGIIIVDRKYGQNLDQDEHLYEYYADCLNRAILDMNEAPLFMRFLNKFVLLFEAKPGHVAEHELEKILMELDGKPQFKGKIRSTCILGAAYNDPRQFGSSYAEAKSLIPKVQFLPNPKNKKVLSASSMGIYKFMFNSGNQNQIMDYCNDKLRKIEEYDHSNGTFLQETLVSYYMHGFNTSRTAEALFIHRNSLQYRLNKITELLGVETDDYMEYLDLINCILVKRLMFN